MRGNDGEQGGMTGSKGGEGERQGARGQGGTTGSEGESHLVKLSLNDFLRKGVFDSEY